MKNNGQALIEAILTLSLVLLLLFVSFKVFKNVTDNILSEVQLIDLLKYGIVKRKNIFGENSLKTKREILTNSINTEVVTYDGASKKQRTFTR